jgi:putative sporulation protein YyaC
MEKEKWQIPFDHPDAVSLLTQRLNELLAPHSHRPLLCLCIGTDRSSGDTLGPLVGTLLTEAPSPNIQICGTLAQPVHAFSLNQVVAEITQLPKTPLIIAIDASLGKQKEVGMVEVGEGALVPGKGVGKKLPAVGDIHIKGIVNAAGAMPSHILQTTRFHVTYEMAIKISRALLTVAATHSTPPI